MTRIFALIPPHEIMSRFGSASLTTYFFFFFFFFFIYIFYLFILWNNATRLDVLPEFCCIFLPHFCSTFSLFLFTPSSSSLSFYLPSSLLPSLLPLLPHTHTYTHTHKRHPVPHTTPHKTHQQVTFKTHCLAVIQEENFITPLYNPLASIPFCFICIGGGGLKRLKVD